MNTTTNIGSGGSSGSGTGGSGLTSKDFTATAGQVLFDCSPLTLTAYYQVFVNGALTTFGHSRVGNTVVFDVGQPENTEIVVIS